MPTGEYIEANMVSYNDCSYDLLGWCSWNDDLVRWEEADVSLKGALTQIGTGYCYEADAYYFAGDEGEKEWVVFDLNPDSELPKEKRSYALFGKTTRKDKNTVVSITEVNAYYGRILEISEDSVLIEGLEINGEKNRSQIWYHKDTLAMITGYTEAPGVPSQRSRFEDLALGDLVCIIEKQDSELQQTDSFNGIAKLSVFGHEAEEKLNEAIREKM